MSLEEQMRRARLDGFQGLGRPSQNEQDKLVDKVTRNEIITERKIADEYDRLHPKMWDELSQEEREKFYWANVKAWKETPIAQLREKLLDDRWTAQQPERFLLNYLYNCSYPDHLPLDPAEVTSVSELRNYYYKTCAASLMMCNWYSQLDLSLVSGVNRIWLSDKFDPLVRHPMLSSKLRALDTKKIIINTTKEVTKEILPSSTSFGLWSLGIVAGIATIAVASRK